eukprot:3756706-Prymnesium_polylepis.1
MRKGVAPWHGRGWPRAAPGLRAASPPPPASRRAGSAQTRACHHVGRIRSTHTRASHTRASHTAEGLAWVGRWGRSELRR